MQRLRRQRARRVNRIRRCQNCQRGIQLRGCRARGPEKCGLVENGALPRGNAFFERLGHLFVNEFERKTFFQVSHHPRLNLAEHDHGF